MKLYSPGEILADPTRKRDRERMREREREIERE
jgi:hypothetical protein